MKRIFDKLEQLGVKPIYGIMIKYFTLPCELVITAFNEQTPIDHFLFSFNYKPKFVNDIGREIANIGCEKDLLIKLSSFFDINSMPILNALVLARTACESPGEIEKSANRNYINDFIFRSFIVLSLNNMDNVESSLAGVANSKFSDIHWQLVHYPMKYLISNDGTNTKDLSDCVRFFIEGFHPYSRILSLNESSIVRKSILSIVVEVLKLIPCEVTKGISCTLEFVTVFLNEWIRKVKIESEITEIIMMSQTFYHKCIPHVSGFDISAQKYLFKFTSDFFETIMSIKRDFDIPYVFISDTFRFLRAISGSASSLSPEVIGDPIKSVLKWMSITNDLSKSIVIRSADPFLEIPNEKITLSQYINHYQIINEFEVISYPQKSFEQALLSIRLYFKAFPEYGPSIVFFVINRINQEVIDDRIRLYTGLFLSLIDSITFNNSELFLELINTTFLSIVNSYKWGDKIGQNVLSYIKVFLHFLYCYSTNSKNSFDIVINTISSAMNANNNSFLMFLLPFFRQLLNGENSQQYISWLVTSYFPSQFLSIINYIKETSIIDSMIMNIYIIASSYPHIVLSHISFLPVVSALFTCEKYYPLLVDCYQSEIIYCSKVLNDSMFSTTFDQISLTIMQSKSHSYFSELSDSIINMIIDSINSFNVGAYEKLKESGLLSLFVTIPGMTHNSTVFLSVIKLFTCLCVRFPSMIVYMNYQTSSLLSPLNSVIPFISINDAIVFAIQCLVFNTSSLKKLDTSSIRNRGALTLLMNCVCGNQYENQILEMLISVCSNNSSNSFECFSCDIIGYCLKRTKEPNVLLNAVHLFGTIGSYFFSTMSLKEMISALSLEKDGFRSIRHQILLNCIIDLIIDERVLPVTSFFHFNGIQTGIIGPFLEPTYFIYPISVASTFCLETRSNCIASLITFIENSERYITVYILNKMMCIKICENGMERDYIFEYIFEPFIWYSMLLFFSNNQADLYINQKLVSSIEVTLPLMEHGVHTQIGMLHSSFFIGNIGPTYVFQSKKIDIILNEFNRSKNDHDSLRKAIMSFVPWNCHDDVILSVGPKSETASFIGMPVPFCTSIKDVLSFEGALQQIFPLFFLLNHQVSGMQQEEDQLFHSLILLLSRLLYLDLKIEEQFILIGGFQLLSSIFTHISPESFTLSFAFDLYDMFENIKSDSLNRQMVDYIWLNIRLWGRLSIEVQKRYLQSVFPVLLNSSKNKYFVLPSLEFLLYLIQSDSLKHICIRNKSMWYPLVLDEAEISTISISDTEIKSLYWNMFQSLYYLSPSPSSLYSLFSMVISLPNRIQRSLAFFTFKKLVLKGTEDVMSALQLFNPFECFTEMISVSHGEEKLFFVKCLLFVGKHLLERTIVFPGRIKFSSIVLSLIEVFNESNDSNEAIFEELVSFLYGYTETEDGSHASCLRFPDILPLIIHISRFTKNSIVMKYAKSILDGVSTFSHKCAPFFTNYKWFFWIFEFVNQVFDFISDQDYIAQVFGSIIFSNIQSGNFSYFQNVFAFFCFVQSFFGVDYSIIMRIILLKVLEMSMDHNLDIAFLRKVIERSVSYLFIKPTSDIQCRTENLSNEQILKLLSFVNSNQTYDVSYHINMVKKDISIWDDQSIAVQIIQILKKIICKNEKTDLLLFGSIEMPYILLYALLISLVHNFSPDLVDGFCDKPSVLGYIRNYSTEVKEKSLIVTKCLFYSIGLYEKDEKAIETVCPFDYFVLILSNIDETKQESQFNASLMSTSKSTSSLLGYNGSIIPHQKAYTEFIKALEKSLNNGEKHNTKLLLSFLREIKTNGGPWSSKQSDPKWIFQNKTDSIGRPVFMKINQCFDDHRSASYKRDQQNITEGTNEFFIPFKKIINQSASLMSKKSKNKSLGSYKVTFRSLSGHYRGTIAVQVDRIEFTGNYFADCFGSEDKSSFKKDKLIEVSFQNLAFVFCRYHLHIDCACEVFLYNWKTYLFIFESKLKRTDFFNTLRTNHKVNSNQSMNNFFFECQNACSGCVQTISSAELLTRTRIVEAWQTNQISNFQYLFFLNILGGRSFCDISQYPIYPWVISDYSRESFDINDPSFYRDFSMPIGALNEKRFTQIQAQLENIEDEIQKCYYRTNMSNPSCVAGFLIRTEPFASLHIRLQDGKFDNPNRLFYSIEAAWNSVQSSVGDYRELIPHFFCNDRFLINSNQFDLGSRSSGDSINNVILPKWCSSALDFINKHRLALESDYVSQHINEWIDLVFGVYQYSEEKRSLFHKFSYHHIVNEIEDIDTKELATNFCANFGSLPTQLFYSTHSKRAQVSIPKTMPIMKEKVTFEKELLLFQSKYALNSHSQFISLKGDNPVINKIMTNIREGSIIALGTNPLGIFINPPGSTIATLYQMTKDGLIMESSQISHRNSIIDSIVVVDNTYVLTVGTDCIIYLWSYPSLEYHGAISLHSYPIVAIDGNSSLDICVSIDDNHNMFVSVLSNRRFHRQIQLYCEEKCVFKVKIAPSGIIVVSSYSPKLAKSTIYFYNIYGEMLNEKKISGSIERIEVFHNYDYNEFVAYSLSSKRIVVIESSSFQIVSEIVDFMNPKFFIPLNGSRKLHYVKVDGQLTTCDF